MTDLKKHISQIPIVGSFSREAFRRFKNFSFSSSSSYWENRYAAGKNSGAGSYNELANFKAEVLNDFVESHNIKSIIEFGSGDGNQLLLANYPSYTGLDVSTTAISICSSKFKDDTTKSFFLYDPKCFIDKTHIFKADISMSLDVIYHLVEDEIFSTHLSHLFNSASRYVIIYSTNDDSPDPHQLPHVKRRNFTDYIKHHFDTWTMLDCIPNKYPLKNFPDSGSDAQFFIYKNISS